MRIITVFQQKNLAPKLLTVFMIIFLSTLLTGCGSDDFMPNEVLVDGVAIHCILDDRCENIIARVQKVHLDNSPVDMSKYKVSISEKFGSEFFLKDTSITSSPNTRFFTLPGKYIKRGSLYLLSLYENGNLIKYAICKTFDKVNWTAEVTFEDSKSGGAPKWNIELMLPKFVQSIYTYKLVVNYVYQSSPNSPKYSEVPLTLYINKSDPEYSNNKFIYEYDYDRLEKTFIHLHINKNISTYQFTGKPTYNSVLYDGHNILACLKSLKKDAPSNIVVKGVSALCYCIDTTYYNYYMKTGNEASSIRMDQIPYSSNIQGFNGLSLGFFGTISCDSIHLKLPEIYIKDCGYIDGQ